MSQSTLPLHDPAKTSKKVTMSVMEKNDDNVSADGDEAADENTPLIGCFGGGGVSENRPRSRLSLEFQEEWAPLKVTCDHDHKHGDEGHVVAIRQRARRWAHLSRKKERQLKYWSYFNLFLQIIGAALTTLATQIPSNISWVVGIIGGACLAFVPIISSNFLGPSTEDEQIRVRNVAENLKSEYYLYLAKVEPYDDKDTRFKRMIDRVQGHLSSVDDVCAQYARTKLSNFTREPMPSTCNRRSYISARLNIQYKEFRKQAKLNADRGALLTIIQYVFGGLAAAIGVLSGSAGSFIVNNETNPSAQAIYAEFVSTKLGAWAAVAATATAAFSGFIKQQKYFELANMFSEAAQKLEDRFLIAHEQCLFQKEQEKQKKEEWNRFVLDCEDIIAQENSKWKALIQKKGPNKVRDDAERSPSSLTDSFSSTAPLQASVSGPAQK